MSVQRLSHIGICVTDLARSVRFYTNALGFEERSRLQVAGEHSATLLEIEDGRVDAVFLERDGTRIELLYFPDAGDPPDNAPRPMNTPGLTHLSLRVFDLEATIKTVSEYKGQCLTNTRIENERWGTQAVFVTDPDGTRIELLQAPGDPDSLPGQ